MKSIRSKALKIIQAVSWLFSLLMIAMAYFRVLDKSICFCATLVSFAIFVVAEFILRNRKIKANKAKGDKWSKIEIFGIITHNLWFLFVVVMVIIFLARAIVLMKYFGK